MYLTARKVDGVLPGELFGVGHYDFPDLVFIGPSYQEKVRPVANKIRTKDFHIFIAITSFMLGKTFVYNTLLKWGFQGHTVLGYNLWTIIFSALNLPMSW